MRKKNEPSVCDRNGERKEQYTNRKKISNEGDKKEGEVKGFDRVFVIIYLS